MINQKIISSTFLVKKQFQNNFKSFTAISDRTALILLKVNNIYISIIKVLLLTETLEDDAHTFLQQSQSVLGT